jgi:cytochrome c5
MLLSGLLMLFQIAEIRTLFIAKLVIVVVALLISWVSFQKVQKGLAVLALLMLVGAYGMADMNRRYIASRDNLPQGLITEVSNPQYNEGLHGQALYQLHCENCHGEQGDRGLSGASNLRTSVLSKDQMETFVRYGFSVMPAYGEDFSDQEIKAILNYVVTFQD